MNISDDIKAEAFRLGFQLAGYSHPETPKHMDVFELWLHENRHATMDYLATPLARKKRASPSLVLTDCQIILSLGIHYPSPSQVNFGIGANELYGRIAAYAWGNDYHEVLIQRLLFLVDRIEHITNQPLRNRYYTDTGPVLERDAAEKAGLGWIGKNTCLINPHQGSYFFLAELFMDISVEPDVPIQHDLCGTCTRCIDACPTNCILPDRTIDARSCISYLTIENKGPIPQEFRSQIGNWVFGCDVCQMVCPWNLRFAAKDIDPAFQLQDQIAMPILQQEIQLSPQQFNQKFKNSPLRRAKRRGYLRNCVVALGNSHAVEAVDTLLLCGKSEFEPLVRGHIAWALGQIGGKIARNGLNQLLQSENDPFVRDEIITALQQGS